MRAVGSAGLGGGVGGGGLGGLGGGDWRVDGDGGGGALEPDTQAQTHTHVCILCHMGTRYQESLAYRAWLTQVLTVRSANKGCKTFRTDKDRAHHVMYVVSWLPGRHQTSRMPYKAWFSQVVPMRDGQAAKQSDQGELRHSGCHRWGDALGKARSSSVAIHRGFRAGQRLTGAQRR
jgi:hypothetical protein